MVNRDSRTRNLIWARAPFSSKSPENSGSTARIPANLDSSDTLYTFDDGSSFIAKSQGPTTTEPGGKVSLIKGGGPFLKGTGRFAGIQGDFSFTGKRLAPRPGAGAHVYLDCTGSFTVSR